MNIFVFIYSLLFVLLVFPPSAIGDFPKIAVWDLAPQNIPDSYARQLTSILVSEITKMKKYEVYSRENIQTLAGWTEEKMKLGCSDTECLMALGQINVTKLISGNIGKIGGTYSISLNLFDTHAVKAENAVSEFCRSEDDLIELVQKTVRKLLGVQEIPAESKDSALKKETEKLFTNSIGMKFVLIPPGRFLMGSPHKGTTDNKDATLLHLVDITKPFFLGQYEVTEAQWQAIMGNKPSLGKEDNLAEGGVSWNDVQEFIKRLNQKENTDKYRLPTEAEWEYACRAGSQSDYCFGDDMDQLSEYAWYKYKTFGYPFMRPQPVGQKKPNAWNLYDMHGNVAELCEDGYIDNAYDLLVKKAKVNPRKDAVKDPLIKSENPRQARVNRGGSYMDDWVPQKCGARKYWSPRQSTGFIGFRLVRNP
jgi:formylglycine-generating enzyme required for sulfatase activity